MKYLFKCIICGEVVEKDYMGKLGKDFHLYHIPFKEECKVDEPPPYCYATFNLVERVDDV